MSLISQLSDPKLIAALMGGLVASLGWLVAYRNERSRENRLRKQREQDVQRALYAEISHYVDALVPYDMDDVLQAVIDQMHASAKYIPVVPSEQNDTLFRALMADIHVLPADIILPVVRYYNQIFAIEAIIADIRSDLFHTMNQEQRIAMLSDYIDLKKEALTLGQSALFALARSVPELSIPSKLDVVQCGPQQGGEI